MNAKTLLDSRRHGNSASRRFVLRRWMWHNSAPQPDGSFHSATPSSQVLAPAARRRAGAPWRGQQCIQRHGWGCDAVHGPWFLAATLNVDIGGTATFLTDTSRVMVGADGNAVITGRDSECGLKVFVNGDVMTYETTCLFTAISGDATVPCTLTLRSRVTIRGATGTAPLSGSFGLQTGICRGVAAA